MNRDYYLLYLDTAAISPLPPESPIIESVSAEQIVLSWLDRSRQESGYLIERCSAGNAVFDSIALLPAGSKLYIDMQLPSSTTFSYRVITLGSGRRSVILDTVTGTTADLPPKTLYELDTSTVREILDSNGLHTVRAAEVSYTDTFHGETRITTLMLNATKLGTRKITTIPAAISQLTALSNIQMSGNTVVALPPQIGSLTNLSMLDVSDNALAVLPEELGRCTNLKHLNAGTNRLTSLPDALGALTGITVLRVNNNKLTALPDTLTTLTGMLFFDFDDNQVCSLSPKMITWLATMGIEDPGWKSGQTCP